MVSRRGWLVGRENHEYAVCRFRVQFPGEDAAGWLFRAGKPAPSRMSHTFHDPTDVVIMQTVSFHGSRRSERASERQVSQRSRYLRRERQRGKKREKRGRGKERV